MQRPLLQRFAELVAKGCIDEAAQRGVVSAFEHVAHQPTRGHAPIVSAARSWCSSPQLSRNEASTRG